MNDTEIAKIKSAIEILTKLHHTLRRETQFDETRETADRIIVIAISELHQIVSNTYINIPWE